MNNDVINSQQLRDKPVTHTSIIPIGQVVYRHRSRDDTTIAIDSPKDGVIGWVEVPGETERHYCFYLEAKGAFLSPEAYKGEKCLRARANQLRFPWSYRRKHRCYSSR